MPRLALNRKDAGNRPNGIETDDAADFISSFNP